MHAVKAGVVVREGHTRLGELKSTLTGISQGQGTVGAAAKLGVPVVFHMEEREAYPPLGRTAITGQLSLPLDPVGCPHVWPLKESAERPHLPRRTCLTLLLWNAP